MAMSHIIDLRLGSGFKNEGMEEFIQLISYVVKLDRILGKEMKLTTIMGEGTPTVTLGSQLFKATR
ncbi:hypothetical protein CR513_45014, partial [Mucuna pruriens]